MSNGLWQYMWNEAALWQIFAAPILGALVGWIYFYSLRWSINHLESTSHKIRMFTIVALLRVALFFAVMVLVGQRNILVILLYILAFFFARMIFIWHEKSGYIVENKKEAGNDGV